MENKKFVIPETMMSEMQLKIDKLNRKAAKLGTGKIEVKVVGTQDVAFKDGHTADTSEIQSGGVYWLRHFEVVVTGATPCVNGYDFVATLQHMLDDDNNTINILRVLPSYEQNLPAQFRTASPEHCDHCQKAIKTRKETYVLCRTETGKFVQVGKNCLSDFLGGIDPKEVLATMEAILEASSMEFDGGVGGSSGSRLFSMVEFLAAAAMFVRTEGWVSKGKACQNAIPESATAERASFYINPPPKGSTARTAWEAWRQECPVTDTDKKTAEQALETVKETLGNKETLGDYEHNLLVVVSQPTVHPKTTGILASAIQFYMNEMGRRVEAEKKKDSKHFGVVGEKVSGVQATLVRELTTEGQYGTTFIYKFLTDEGNSCTWFASKNNSLQVGKKYSINGVVKAHNEFKGVKDTVLTRCKLSEV